MPQFFGPWTVLLGVVVLGSYGQADEWFQFRGPNATAKSDSQFCTTHWTESENIAWRTPIPGMGWSSPIVHEGKIWLTTGIAEPDESGGESEEIDDPRPYPVIRASRVHLQVVALDLESGEIVHQGELFNVDGPEPIHTMNSYASPTCVADDGLVYCCFGAYGLAAVRADNGQVVWKNCDLRLNHATGPGSSPIVWHDLVIVNCDGIDVQYVAAVDKRTGEIRWKQQRSGQMHEEPEFRKAYSTPVVIHGPSGDVIVSPGCNWVYGYDPATGEELWKVSYGTLGFSTTPQPILSDEFIYVCTGFMQSRLLAMRFDPRAPEQAPVIEWKHTKQVPTITTPILFDGLIYFVSEGGVLTAVDAKTGEQQYRERLGGKFAASPIASGGNLYFFDRDGVCTVVRPGSQFAEVARNKLPTAHMATPALVDDGMILRTEDAVYRIENMP